MGAAAECWKSVVGFDELGTRGNGIVGVSYFVADGGAVALWFE